jgi:hypothetical protein
VEEKYRSLREESVWIAQATQQLAVLSSAPDLQLASLPDFVDKPFELIHNISPLLWTQHLESEDPVTRRLAAISTIKAIATERDYLEDGFFWSEEGVRESEHWQLIREVAAWGIQPIPGPSKT